MSLYQLYPYLLRLILQKADNPLILECLDANNHKHGLSQSPYSPHNANISGLEEEGQLYPWVPYRAYLVTIPTQTLNGQVYGLALH